jgi:D-aminopeptidase
VISACRPDYSSRADEFRYQIEECHEYPEKNRNILIIADIEGSSGCLDNRYSSFMTPQWPGACLGMTLDVKALTDALLEAGAAPITVKDFHRTGYNIFPGMLHPAVRLLSGYSAGPVPGLGDPGKGTALLMIGMHAPSGSEGFLPHTLTSRIAKLTVNGETVSEAQLFSASLAGYG